MAALDDLLARIDDPALRSDIDRELEPLRGERELGLVFERHLPEKVRLPGLPIREGTKVEIRSDASSPAWQVTKVSRGKAQLVRTDSDGSTVTETQPIQDLIVIREFGDPIYPGLRSVGTVERGGERPFHTVINSENFHALEMLLYTCAGEVDVIYIDPPYNTGDRSWKYNNDFVDKGDDYRHSKWLSFMEKRLELAKKLLRTEDGILIVTIDEHEVHRLALLLQRIFPNHIHTMLTVVINPKGTIRGQFGRVEEFALFVIPDSKRNFIAGKIINDPPSDEDDEESEDDVPVVDADFADEVEETEEEVEEEASEGRDPNFEYQLFRRRGSSSLREDRPNRFYPIYIDDKKGTIEAVGETLPMGKNPSFRRVKGLLPIWPIDSEGNHRVWRWKASRTAEIIHKPDEQGRYLELGRYNAAVDNWTINLVVPRKSTVKQKTVWWETRHDAGTHGTTLLQRFLGKSRQFSYPKSLYLVRDTLDVVVRDRPNALILDFFGGSGTTAHAVALLNQVDNGNRRSIIVTNNEVESKLADTLLEQGLRPGGKDYEDNGIFWNVTKPRLEAAVTGVRRDGKAVPGKYLDRTPFANGLEENFEFFELTYEDPDLVQLGAAFQSIAPLLWLKAGATGPQVLTIDGSWSVPDGGQYGILFDVNGWPEFCETMARSSTATHAFIVTDSEAVFQRIANELPSNIAATRLYESYLTSFAINTRMPQ